MERLDEGAERRPDVPHKLVQFTEQISFYDQSPLALILGRSKVEVPPEHHMTSLVEVIGAGSATNSAIYFQQAVLQHPAAGEELLRLEPDLKDPQKKC